MADPLGNKRLIIDDNPQWNNSIFHEGNLPPNTVVFDDLDLGCDPTQPVEDPTPSLEGYWDRDDTNGYLYPKQLSDAVMVGKTAPTYGEMLGVTGSIYTNVGYLLDANSKIYRPAANQIFFQINSVNALKLYYGTAKYLGGEITSGWKLPLDTPSISAPPYTFQGDEDTGMYHLEANGIGFVGGGSSLLALNADGSIILGTIPTDDPTSAMPALAIDTATGKIHKRDLDDLHVHSNISVLDLLGASGGKLTYNGVLVTDFTGYATEAYVDAADAILQADINTRSLNTHNHTLVSLTEHSYTSLTDKPDLTSLHIHTNKPTLDVIADYTSATQNDLLIRDAAGTAWVPPSTFSVPIELVNGSFRETFDARVTSNGTDITMSLEQTGTGNLTMQFSDGYTTLDCTPALTIILTAGTDAIPQKNYIYILQSTKALTKSTSDWPAIEHIKVGFFLVSSPTYVQAEGPLINQNWNDHLSGTDNMGHLGHISERARRDAAHYFSGIDGTGTDDYTTSTTGSVTVQCSSGVAYQLHAYTYAAKDTSGTDDIHVVNHDTTPYYATQNLYNVVNDANGGSLTNRYFNIVLWGVINKTGEYSPLFVNLPTGSYNVLNDAVTDKNGYDVFSMPREFNLDSSTGFLIARLTFRKEGTSWTYHSTVDLRGQTSIGVATGGVGGSITSFSDAVFDIYNNADNTKLINFDLSGLTTATTRVITPYDGNVSLVNYDGSILKVDAIQELTLNAGILLGNVMTVDQENSRVGIGEPVPAYKLDVAGSGRFAGTTLGQSIIGYGLIINNQAYPGPEGDFQVKTDIYNAIAVDASEDSILIMSNILGKVGFFNATPSIQSTGWSVTNHVVDKIFNANATTINELCDVLGELITELKLKGILGS